ncbi:PAAR domain-containing protein [Pseudomonas sp. RIT412]|uniref:PAAR domain-containing protein n=1 Tax=Pseudomonas sp. RIT409 TaxID=2202159 RepID=UPI000D3A6A66|nr:MULTISPECIES: PAAR domain-containing protein [unclassified Pseudomonas]RAU49325.1 PAAR domain-containing protein [Pseudomonas sp. RIT 409]RAU55934.1 PAAR domain-containing protein [Pseudomonas sp. RIT 412]
MDEGRLFHSPFDRTTCGGKVQQATSNIDLEGLDMARMGDVVSCGVDGKLYQIEGGLPHFTADNLPVAGTLHSVSGCPCRSILIPSVVSATYAGNSSIPAPHHSLGPSGAVAATSPRKPASAADDAGDDLEEEEEEVELEPLITLRAGVKANT